MGVFYPLDFFSYFCKGKKFRSSSDYPPNEIYDFAQSIPSNKHHDCSRERQLRDLFRTRHLPGREAERSRGGTGSSSPKGQKLRHGAGGTAGIISDGIGGTVMIRLEQAEKQYKNFHLDCSMEVQEGMVTGLIGPNGAGKSTTFRLLTGLAKPEAGRVQIFGKEISELTAEDRRKIGVVWSDAGFSGYLMGKDLIAVLKNMYPAFDENWFRKKCEEFHLPMDKKLKDFSTGMKAKLKVLSAVANGDARLLILDEPTAGMDVMVREQILDLLREFMMPGDRSILISSHISSDLEGFCDDVYLMNQGKIILHEDVDTLLEQYGILKVTTEQYDTLDKEYLLRVKKEDYGYACLTGQKDFYQENWPQIIVEKGTIDQIMTMMVEGK